LKSQDELTAGDAISELSDDAAYVIPVPVSEMQKRRERLKKKNLTVNKSAAQERDDGFEIVADDPVGSAGPAGPRRKMENYNLDTLAETLAVAKKMIRKKNRERIIEDSYSRHAVEDYDNLPKWFREDEQKHCFKRTPVTRQDIEDEKQRLMAINARAPKKVIEAKIRKAKRLDKKIKKAKTQA